MSMFDTDSPDYSAGLPNRVAKKIEVSADGCWLWTGELKRKDGYGLIRAAGGAPKLYAYAHRVVYQLLVGPIPDGLTIDHLCRVRRCVNPAHLEPVTNRENILRGMGWAAVNARKTHCPAGHPYDAANTIIVPSRPRARYCRACHQRRSLERSLRRAAAA